MKLLTVIPYLVTIALAMFVLTGTAGAAAPESAARPAGSSGHGRALSRATVIARGDRACRARQPLLRALERRAERVEKNPSLRRAARLFRDIARAYRGLERRIEPLVAQARPSRSLSRYLEGLTMTARSADKTADAIDRRSTGGIEYHTERLVSNLAGARRAARAYRFRSCGRLLGV